MGRPRTRRFTVYDENESSSDTIIMSVHGTVWPNSGAAFNRRPAEQPDGSANLSEIVAAGRFPAAVAGR